jgi:hypothetical protein
MRPWIIHSMGNWALIIGTLVCVCVCVHHASMCNEVLKEAKNSITVDLQQNLIKT